LGKPLKANNEMNMEIAEKIAKATKRIMPNQN
jgi:hypothetical protein